MLGQTINEAIVGSGFACRWGGDEFVICVSDKNYVSDLNGFTQKLLRRLGYRVHYS